MITGQRETNLYCGRHSLRFAMIVTVGLWVIVSLLSGCVAPPKDPTSLEKANAFLDQGVFESEEMTKVSQDTASVTQSLTHAYATDESDLEKTEEKRFNLSVKDMPANIFFMGLVDETTYNMSLHPGLTGSLTLDLNNVTIREVLEVARNVYGYEYTETMMGFEVFPPQLQTKIYKVDYLFMNRSGSSGLSISSTSLTSGGGGTSAVNSTSTQDLWVELKTVITEMLSKGGNGQSVSVSPQSGIVIVTAMPHELRKIEEFLAKMQGSLNRQVILEAKILEVTLSNKNQQGIDWNKVSGRLNFAQVGGGSTLSGSGSSSTTSVSGRNGAIVDVEGQNPVFPNISADQLFGGVFSATLQLHNFAAFLELLSEQGNVQVLSSPRVSTMNNQQAIIKIGTDAYYVTNVTNSSSSAGGAAAATSSSNITLTPFFSGIALDVTPFVDDDDNVTLHVHPTITVVSTANVTVTLNGQNQVLPLAQNNVRESDTVIRSRSGQIVVIGGLMKNETVEVSTSIPYIDKIPFIGNLTRQKQQQKLKSELIILLRPLVTRVDNYDSVLKDAQRRVQDLNRGFHSGPNPEMFGNIRETQRLP